MAEERAEVERACAVHGIAPAYHDIWGKLHEVPTPALRALLAEFGDAAPAALRATPPAHAPRCWRPELIEQGGRVWGPAVQLYALRSSRNWGIGDFGDLGRLIDWSAARGAGIVGLNPLHALFLHNPAHASPYSPSSRLMWNPLYLEIEAIEDFRESKIAHRTVRSRAFQQHLARLRAAPFVDYSGVAELKLAVLRDLYRHFLRFHRERKTPRDAQFEQFRVLGGEALRKHAEWEAAHNHGDEPGFFEYLQWQADAQLAGLAARCRARGMPVGLYLDLAVSVDRGGSEMWANAGCFAPGASIGAPPDDFNPLGQNWGLPPLRPDRLRENCFELFERALAVNMRHAGALRIDHVMGLLRLFWIPPGGAPAEGAYVHYPLDELLGVVAAQSQREQCMVIGEDLGTVPDEVRAACARAGILSYRLLWFERDGAGEFRPPADYPREALVQVSTHDLPTLAGWWRRPGTEADRERLRGALERAGLTPGEPPHATAVHAWVAQAPSAVMLVQLEDLLGVGEQVNVPGTTFEHPNWRRKLPVEVEKFFTDARLEEFSRVIRETRAP